MVDDEVVYSIFIIFDKAGHQPRFDNGVTSREAHVTA